MEVVEVFAICRESIQLGKGSIVGGEGRSSLARAQPPGCAVNHFLVCLVNRKQMRLVCIAIAADSGRDFGGGTDRSSARCGLGSSPPKRGMHRDQRASWSASSLERPHEARNEREYARM
jgi:hypothetical protein